MMNKRVKDKLTLTMRYVVLILLSVVFLVPLYYGIINSLRATFGAPVVFPKVINFKNYYHAVTLVPFWKYLKNSFIIVLITVPLSVAVDFIYGYAFARLRVKRRDTIFGIVLMQMMIPSFAIMIPQYVFFNSLGLKNSFWIYVLLCIAGDPYTIFLYRQYMQNIPRELEEAAIIDGCGYTTLIIRILLPLCKSVIAIVFFNSFIVNWGDYMVPFMYFTQDKYPLASALFDAEYALPQNPGKQLEPVVFAAAIIMMLPVIIVFFSCQKQLADGVVAGAVKG